MIFYLDPSDDVVFYRKIGEPIEVNLNSPKPKTPVACCKFGFFGDYYLAANFNSDEWKDKIIYIGKNKTCSIKLESITDEFFGEWTIWTIFNTTSEQYLKKIKLNCCYWTVKNIFYHL